MGPRADGQPAPARALTPRATNDDLCADPLRIIARSVVGPSDDSPETVLVAWLLSLPDALDPAIAAERVLIRFADQEQGPDAPRLLKLLNETARWPRERLARLRRKPERSRSRP